jgi:hypothetical protein
LNHRNRDDMPLGKWIPTVIASILISACNQPGQPPAASPIPAAPAAATQVNPAPPPGPITENLPPSTLDANPPGTPAYVIAPGPSFGPRNSQIIQPGGKPAF